VQGLLETGGFFLYICAMIQLDQVSVHLPQGYLFKEISVQINANDKVGLVGKNGAGKSTMLRLIADQNKPSEGSIHKPKDCTIGFLTQDIELDTEQTVFNYLVTSNVALKEIKDRIDAINAALVTREDYESESYLAMLDELNDLNHEFSIKEDFNGKRKW
jgi:ATP-binding cassette subfamily F protein 3